MGAPSATSPNSPRVVTLVLPAPRSYQRPMIRDRARDVAVVSATQVGKTTAAAIWLASRAWESPGTLWGWYAPTHDMLRVGFRVLSTLLQTAGVLARKTESAGDMRLQLANPGERIGGSTIQFASWHEHEHLRGPTIAGAVVDEAGLLEDEAAGIISSRRSATLGPIRWLGNPGFPSGPFRRLCDKGADPTRDPALYSTYRWTWRESANALPCVCGLPPIAAGELPVWFAHPRTDCERRARILYIAGEAQGMPEEMFGALHEALWTVPEGSVFRPASIRDKTTGEPAVSAEAGRRYVIGVDVAQEVDYLVACVWDADGPRLVAMDRWRGLPYHASEARLADLSRTWNGATLVIETNGPGRPLFDALAYRGVPVREWVTTAQSKGPAILAFAAALHDPASALTLAPLAPLQEELAAFRFERTLNGFRYSAPTGMHDDCVMAAVVGHQALAGASLPWFVA